MTLFNYHPGGLPTILLFRSAGGIHGGRFLSCRVFSSGSDLHNFLHHKSRDTDMNESIRLSKGLLELMGVFDTESELNLWWLKTLLLISPMLILYVAELFELFHVSKDFRQFNDNLGMILLGGIGLFNYITMIYYRKGMINLEDKINHDKINVEPSNTDFSILEKYDRAGLKLSKTVTYIVVGVCTGVILQGLPDIFLGSEGRLPIRASYPFSLNSTELFMIVYVSQVLTCYLYVLAFVTSSAWVIFLTYHVCGHFSVLENYLERIGEDDEERNGFQSADKRKTIIKCIRLHQNIYDITDDIERYFTLPNLIHFLCSSVGICTSAYGISTSWNEPEELVKHVSAIFAQFALLSMVNWCGQLIEDKSLGVGLAICRSDFHKLDTHHRKNLAFILCRAQRPVHITAGKFYNLSLESMANILKASMSCFAMFTNME